MARRIQRSWEALMKIAAKPPKGGAREAFRGFQNPDWGPSIYCRRGFVVDSRVVVPS